MLLRRLYPASGGRVLGVEILRSGKNQRFSTGLVEGAILEGWLSIDGGCIILMNGAVGEGAIPVKYKIMRVPGYYCCHCGLGVGDSIAGKVHVTEKHKDKKSPDESNPAGYERINYYDCKKGK